MGKEVACPKMSDGGYPSAELVVAQLRSCGVTHVVTVPDWVQISLHKHLVDGRCQDIRVVSCSSEDEAMAISGGLLIAGATPVVVIQNQGLYASVNGLRAIGIDARIPIVMMIGQFGREEGNLHEDTQQSTRFIVRLLEPLLDTLGIPYFPLGKESDLANIQKAFDLARKEETPTAVITEGFLGW